MEQQEFIGSVLPGAKKAYQDYNILPSLTIAQAILESGWGSNAPGNMLFGIKWQEGCGYNPQLLWTTEYINGQYERIQDNFRAYDSMADSVYDHAQFLVNNSRYAPVLQANDYKEACTLIKECGYATDPNYTSSLIAIIEENNLQQYDEEAKREKVDSEVPEATQSINLLAEHGVITDTSYWIENVWDGGTVKGEYMQAIINRFVAMYVKVDGYTYNDVVYALSGLTLADGTQIITQTVDWFNNTQEGETCSGADVTIVLNRMAQYIRENS